MTKIYSIIAVLLVTLASCKNQQKSSESLAQNFVTVEESSCEGFCPVYSMTIYTNGKADFVGKLHTKKIGEHTYKYSEEEVQEIFNVLDNLDFERFSEDEGSIVDIPETKITYNSKSIIIRDVRKIPESFSSMIIKLKKLTRQSGFVN